MASLADARIETPGPTGLPRKTFGAPDEFSPVHERKIGHLCSIVNRAATRRCGRTMDHPIRTATVTCNILLNDLYCSDSNAPGQAGIVGSRRCVKDRFGSERSARSTSVGMRCACTTLRRGASGRLHVPRPVPCAYGRDEEGQRGRGRCDLSGRTSRLHQLQTGLLGSP